MVIPMAEDILLATFPKLSRLEQEAVIAYTHGLRDNRSRLLKWELPPSEWYYLKDNGEVSSGSEEPPPYHRWRKLFELGNAFFSRESAEAALKHRIATDTLALMAYNANAQVRGKITGEYVDDEDSSKVYFITTNALDRIEYGDDWMVDNAMDDFVVEACEFRYLSIGETPFLRFEDAEESLRELRKLGLLKYLLSPLIYGDHFAQYAEEVSFTTEGE